MLSTHHILRNKVINERKDGKTYGEIRAILKIRIPKSTLSYWCKGVNLPAEYQNRIKKIVKQSGQKGRLIAVAVNKAKREKYLAALWDKNKHLAAKLKDKDTARIALAMLYMGEGAKHRKGALLLGNSNPYIIKAFLSLLRHCFRFEENRFRCTLQCRADQNVKKLELFWSKVTQIPLTRFYKARIDPRTVGKPTKKKDYLGVCRIELFSADVYNEICSIIKILESLYKGPVV